MITIVGNGDQIRIEVRRDWTDTARVTYMQRDAGREWLGVWKVLAIQLIHGQFYGAPPIDEAGVAVPTWAVAEAVALAGLHSRATKLRKALDGIFGEGRHP